MSKTRLLVLFILVLAFAARIYALDTVRQEIDRSYPHGLAIATLESILAGRPEDPLPRNSISTLGIPNPIGVELLWMLVALFDRSAFAATAISAMLGVLAVAMTFDLARRLFGRTPALVAAVLMAASPWSVHIARGAFLQGQLEFCVVASAWLLFIALKRLSSRRTVVALAAAAALMQTYGMALALAGQTAVAAVVSWPMARGGGRKGAGRKLWKPLVIGFTLVAISALWQLLPFVTLRASGDSAIDPLAAARAYPIKSDSIPNPFGIHLNVVAFDHILRLASGRDFENEYLDRNATYFNAYERITDVRAAVVDLLMLAGFVIACARAFSRKQPDPGSRLVLAWFLLPALTFTVLMAIVPTLHTTYYYLTIASPAPYLLAGLPFALLDRSSHDSVPMQTPAAQAVGALRPLIGPMLGAAALLAGLATIVISAYGLYAQADYVIRAPQFEDVINWPLGWQAQLGQAWRANCDEIDQPMPLYWLVSIAESARPVRTAAYHAAGASEAWQVSPQGRNCVLKLNGPAPLLADAIPLQFDSRNQATLYRSQPIPAAGAIFGPTSAQPELKPIPGSGLYVLSNARGPLNTNISWSLLDLSAPPQARPGGWITIVHVWRIDRLPDEPFASWYYAPFVTLRTPDGRRILLFDNAPSIEGHAWQPGGVILSAVRLQLPADLAPGTYKLELSLFDPNQKKNAVYFSPAAPGKPIIALERILHIADN